MFLDRVNFMYRELGRAHGLRLVLLLIGPLLLFGALALLLGHPA
jgi:hypothetical protein